LATDPRPVLDPTIADYYGRAPEESRLEPAWLFADIAERMQDDRRRTEVLHVARLLESEPSVLGASAHLLAVAVR
jgi:hypothetical protein